jgi:hypothetical protein
VWHIPDKPLLSPKSAQYPFLRFPATFLHPEEQRLQYSTVSLWNGKNASESLPDGLQSSPQADFSPFDGSG